MFSTGVPSSTLQRASNACQCLVGQLSLLCRKRAQPEAQCAGQGNLVDSRPPLPAGCACCAGVCAGSNGCQASALDWAQHGKPVKSCSCLGGGNRSWVLVRRWGYCLAVLAAIGAKQLHWIGHSMVSLSKPMQLSGRRDPVLVAGTRAGVCVCCAGSNKCQARSLDRAQHGGPLAGIAVRLFAWSCTGHLAGLRLPRECHYTKGGHSRLLPAAVVLLFANAYGLCWTLQALSMFALCALSCSALCTRLQNTLC